MKAHEYVICNFCGNRYVGIIPKGGDGTQLLPRRHRLITWQDKVLRHKDKRTCPGSYSLVTPESQNEA